MTICALFFDFDGLLCDTERAAHHSWVELYGEFGLRFPDDLWAGMAGRANGERLALDDLARRLGRHVDEPTRARRRQRKSALCRLEPLRPGVAQVIDAAERLGLTVALVSNSPRAWVQDHLARLGVADRFEVLVTGDDVQQPKPAPDVYQAALARTSMTAVDVLAFEDSTAGLRAARAAGLHCVAVPSSVTSFLDLTAADIVVDSLTTFDLEAYVRALEPAAVR